MRRTYPFFCEALHQQWELLVQNMLCDLQGLVTGFVHKITDMTIQRRKWSEIKSFMIVMPPSLNAILSIQMKWLCSWIILVKTRKHFTYSSSISIVFFFSFLFFSFLLFFFNNNIHIFLGELFCNVQERTLICLRADFFFFFKYPYKINNSIFEIKCWNRYTCTYEHYN